MSIVCCVASSLIAPALEIGIHVQDPRRVKPDAVPTLFNRPGIQLCCKFSEPGPSRLPLKEGIFWLQFLRGAKQLMGREI